ncbi:MAG TPA: CBS domain-containing protein [Anaerolineae bacterium]|nr:CBS domain-containing protein [Anaerolineae bacterium]
MITVHLQTHYLEELRCRIVAWLNRYQPPAQMVLLLTALIVGLGTGFGAVVFRWLIAAMRTLSFQQAPHVLGFLGSYYVIIIPAIGGLFVGPMVYFFAREAKGHGVPEVMEAMVLRGGRIRPIVVVIKSLASSICIGTGGSVGREGPIVQIGSALGSTLGQMLRLSDERIRNLVACGAAGGIAATFNTPIAGVFFALEIIVGEFSVGYFSSVVIAAVTASVIGRVFLGNVPSFPVPPYSLVSAWEFGLYAILGVLAALTGVVFVRLLYHLEDLFDAWAFTEYLKPAAGGLLVGLVGFFFPQVFGVGYETIEMTLLGQVALGTAVLLLVAKVLATSLTLGSGGSGGIFAPSLFIGSMLGGTFGLIVHQLWPQATANPGAYALVGMSAVFAGAAHAPVTAVIILFEMTGDYRIILPLMLATAISTILARHLLHHESIYTLKLSRRGIRLERGQDIDVMQGVLVEEVMTRDVDTVPAAMPLSELAAEFQRTAHHGFPVLDENGELFGMVTLQDLRNALSRSDAESLTAADIATRSVLTVYPDEPMWTALKRMSIRDLGRLPVVDRNNPRQVVGLVRRNDIVRAYNIAIVRRAEMQSRTERLRLARLDKAEFVDIDLTADSSAVGKAVAELHLPHDCVLVSIRRGRQVIIPHGNTRLQAGDRVTAFVSRDEAAALHRCLNAHKDAEGEPRPSNRS